MKHLKPFNESVDNWSKIKTSEVLDFVNNSHLVYLIDEGYIVDIKKPRFMGNHNNNDQLSKGSYIRIINIQDNKVIPKPWEEMKDYIIPFLKRFLNEFKLSNGDYWHDDIEVEMGLKCISVTDNLALLKSSITAKTFSPNDIYDNKIKLGKGDCIAEVYWIKIKKN